MLISLFADMPPGTGDVPLTVFQTLPVDGIVIVSSSQELVGMIVGKAVQMAHDACAHPRPGREHELRRLPRLRQAHQRLWRQPCGTRSPTNAAGAELAKMPIDPELAKEADAGMIEMFAGDYLDNAAWTV